ncbi:diaminopimelate epimerase [Sphingorhabdus lutea]|uniref:Diaminopimelate epimerase n=1 Tax=Sphingorhabdus lutea TaxID=1913578 RepID=A0A1L3JCC5_9SPHN|nr:diaminopimelate epimerase [Sphingorhabdus lutea]APG62781.1 diaminopimelate epimerase [Sphingorhabdus lutea]
MSKILFHKMHGLGNDFVIIDQRVNNDAIDNFEIDKRLAQKICDRQFGVGCDQLIILKPSDKADLRMDIYNVDGTAASACGNASRCVVSLMGADCTIETNGGIISGSWSKNNCAVNMGKAHFNWDEIPLAYPVDNMNIPMAWDDIDGGAVVNVGNPHIVFFGNQSLLEKCEISGLKIATDPFFVNGVNANFAHISHDNIIHLNVWERGAGATMACGTGACATAVIAIKKRLVLSPATVRQRGGDLVISWQEGGDIIMSGPATYVFNGEFNPEEI